MYNVMNFTMKIKKLFLLLLCIFTTISSTDQNIILKNIYHHRGTSHRDAPQCGMSQRGAPQQYGNQLELGTVVFYFSAKPVIEKLKSERISDSLTKNIYNIRGVRLQKEKISALPIKGKQYEVTMHLVADVLHLVIAYNPHMVAIEFNTFDSISLQKGIAIHFLDCTVVRQQSVVLNKKKNSKQKTVVIDCGHGGNDAGATGCFGIKEKDIVLAVGLRLAQLLKKADIRVLLTRSCDVSLVLDERTSYANYHNADLFISLHANYAQNVSAQGIDTFCMDASLLHRDRYLSDGACGDALQELIKVRAHESNRLARVVHESVIMNVKNKYPTVVDRKIKHEVAQILLGSYMPAILIELGFVSHAQEAKWLQDPSYQYLLAQSIRDGVITYLKE